MHLLLPLRCHFLHLQTLAGHNAASTVTVEVADNLWKMCHWFYQHTGEWPIVMMDNIKIQANIPDRVIESRYGTLTLPEGCRLRFPAHSPDINQCVEHAVGVVKEAAADQVFSECCQQVQFTDVSLRRIFQGVFNRFKSGELYPKGVEHNFDKLPAVIQVIGSQEGAIVQDNKGKEHYGSGGNWPNADDR